MTYNNLFTIPESNDDAAAPPRRVDAARPAPAIRVGAGRAVPIETPLRPTGGLGRDYEYSTGYARRPVFTDDLPLMPEGRSGRVKLAVMLALVAVLAVAALGTALVFAAGH